MKKRLIRSMLTGVLALTMMIPLGTRVVKADENAINWKVHTGTALHQTDSNWKFVVGDYNGDGAEDLYCIIHNGATGSGRTEVHILDGAKNFGRYLLQTSTSIPLSENWDFDLGDYNNDGKKDLYCFFKSPNQKADSTEVHILDGATNLQKFLLQQALPLSQTNENWHFKVADGDHDGKDDVYAIQTSGTASGKTEVHAVSAASAFRSFFIHSATALGKVDNNWDFDINDYNGDGNPDIYSICKKGTGTKTTEVHILDGYKNAFSGFLLQRGTLLGEVTDVFDIMVGKGKLNLYCIQKSGTGTNKTEVHLMGYDEPANKPNTNKLDIKRESVVNEAKKYLGVPYVWGGTSPSGFDCSGLVQYVYKHALGIDISRTTSTQVNAGIGVSASDLKPGDLVFPHSGHVQMYIGNGKVIHAPQTGDVVKISNLGKVWKARRIIY